MMMKKVYGREAANPHKKMLDQINQYDNPARKKEAADVDAVLDEMAKQMDQDAAEIGITIAELFRTLTVAYLTMPDMEFHSEMVCVVRDEDGITVTVCKPQKDENGEDDDYEDDSFPCDGECENCPGCDGIDDDFDYGDCGDYGDYDDEEDGYDED